MYDTNNLQRFVEAQEPVYESALAELAAGRRRTDWVRFIFPQLTGQRTSELVQRYSIESLEEARAYLEHPLLGPRLRMCCQQLLDLENRSATDILGGPEDMRLRASMTLFAVADSKPGLFNEVLDKYFRGQMDARTLELLKRLP